MKASYDSCQSSPLAGGLSSGAVPPHMVKKKKNRLKVIKVGVWSCERTVVGVPSVTLHVSQVKAFHKNRGKWLYFNLCKIL